MPPLKDAIIGIYHRYGHLSIDQSTISGNQSTGGHAGGLFLRDEASVTYCTVTANTSAGHSGGIWAHTTTAARALRATVLAGNQDGSGDSPDLPLSSGAAVVSWGGNLIGHQGLVSFLAGLLNYTWRDGQFLEQVSGPGGAISYDYDFQGNRIAETLNEQTISYHVDMTFDYAQVLAEYDGNGSLLASYTVGLERLSMQRNGQTYYYITDGFGSVRYLLDEQGGEVGRYTYDAFGNVIDMQVNVENRFLFRGEFLDSLTGDYYLRARWFTPSNGQFTSMDPDAGDMFFPQTLHRYVYCAGDPVNRIDPSGQFSLNELNITQAINETLQRIQGPLMVNKYYKTAKTTIKWAQAVWQFALMFFQPEKTSESVVFKTKGVWAETKMMPDVFLEFNGNVASWANFKVRFGILMGNRQFAMTLSKDGVALEGIIAFQLFFNKWAGVKGLINFAGARTYTAQHGTVSISHNLFTWLSLAWDPSWSVIGDMGTIDGVFKEDKDRGLAAAFIFKTPKLDVVDLVHTAYDFYF